MKIDASVWFGVYFLLFSLHFYVIALNITIFKERFWSLDVSRNFILCFRSTEILFLVNSYLDLSGFFCLSKIASAFRLENTQSILVKPLRLVVMCGSAHTEHREVLHLLSINSLCRSRVATPEDNLECGISFLIYIILCQNLSSWIKWDSKKIK